MKLKQLLQVAAMGGALLSATANAQLEIPTDQYWDDGRDPNGWRTVVAFPMLWAPSINIENVNGTTGGKTDATISFKDIVENLKMGLMGELYVTKAWWGIFFKAQYLKVATDEIGDSSNVGNDTGINVNLGVTPELKMGLYDMGMSWRVWRNLRIITLARATAIEATIEVEGNASICIAPGICTPVGGGDGSFNEKIDVDPGLAWDYNLGLEYGWWMGKTKRHGLNLYGDFAVAGDSEKAWVAEMRYMYRVSKLNSFWLGWRYYEQETHKDDEGDYSVISMNGPLAGWAFTF